MSTEDFSGWGGEESSYGGDFGGDEGQSYGSTEEAQQAASAEAVAEAVSTPTATDTGGFVADVETFEGWDEQLGVSISAPGDAGGGYIVSDPDVNLLASWFGVESWDTRRELTPEGELVDVGTGLTASFSPLAMIASAAIGGIPGMIAGGLIRSVGDPLEQQFSLMGGPGGAIPMTDEERAAAFGGDGGVTEIATDARTQLAQQLQAEPEAGDDLFDEVSEILQRQTFQAFAMPDFTRLSNEFGKTTQFDLFPSLSEV